MAPHENTFRWQRHFRSQLRDGRATGGAVVTSIDRLLSKFPDAQKTAQGWSARCPAHEDRQASLSIAQGANGGAVLHCHAGCASAKVVAAVGLTLADLMPTASKSKANRSRTNDISRIVATYDYRDEAGNLLFQSVRYSPKTFKQRRPKAGGGWIWSVKGAVRVIPYRLPELLAEPTRPVIAVEGEKDCDALAKIGVLATCNAEGAGKWSHEHSTFITDRNLIVIGDNDDPGRKHAQQVAQLSYGIAKSVRVVELLGLPPKGDVSDWLASGGTRAELNRLIEATPPWTPAAVSEPWSEIEPFGVLDLPAFPTKSLPLALRRWVEAESWATQTPPDLAALLALANCSAAIARKVVVEARPGWPEPVNLFVAILLEPGSRKSAVFADAIRPLRAKESAMIEAARPTVARAQSDRRQDEARLRKLEKLAAEKGDADARNAAGGLAEELARQPEPALPRLIVDDVTSEKLGMVLAEQGGRIASMSPEGGAFDLMAGLYSKSGMPQFGVYLMGHSGDDIVTDRVGRRSVSIERPALTCAYAMQPAVVEGLAENAAFRGRGLLARFLYAAPASWIGTREIATAPVSEEASGNYHRTIQALADLSDEHVLHLTADASASLCEWEREVEVMLGDGGEMEIMRDWGGKLAGATLRLAAVIHCAEHSPAVPISRQTIAAAIEIGRYLIPHAEAVMDAMKAKEKSADDDARYVLKWIERHDLKEFTKRDAQQHGKRKFPNADDIDPAAR